MKTFRTSVQSLDTWEEVSMAQVFRAAREYVENGAANVETFVPGLSVALSMGCYSHIPHSRPVAIANFHSDLCRRKEIQYALQAFGGREFKSEFRKWKGMKAYHMWSSELLIMYLFLMELWALDVGLTYQYRTDTMYGEFMLNTEQGPKLWE